MNLPSDTRRWPQEWRDQLQERWNIREFDGGMEEKAALRAAIADVRKLAEEEG